MESQARDSLGEIVRQYGPGVIDDPRRCEAFLRDLCPGLRREVNVLVSAMREGIPARLRASAVPAASALDELAADLARDLALATDAARWAVESWAVALGLVDDSSVDGASAPPAAPLVSPPQPATFASPRSDGRPAGWPDYLSRYRPPPSMSWASFRVSPIDGMPQVLIPAGEFLMGSPPNERGRRSDEGPQKRVYVPSLWMDLHEATMRQYKEFCAASGRRKQTKQSADDRHPVALVSWDDANAYAAWAGRRLPTEAQWEKAARGGTSTTYPWGDDWDPQRANGAIGGPGKTTAVGTYPPNGFGLLDLIGNVSEWCLDWYDEDWYGRMPARDPVKTTRGSRRVCRGGSWFAYPAYLRVACRHVLAPSYRAFYTGFRCCQAA